MKSPIRLDGVSQVPKPPETEDMLASHRTWRGTKKASLPLVRAWNQRLVLDAIRAHGSLSRLGLAKCTGLDPATVSRIVDELIGMGFVREEGKGPSAGGRRPVMLTLDCSRHFFLTVTVLVREIEFIVHDFGFSEIVQRQIRLAGPLEPSEFAELLQGGLELVKDRSLLGAGVAVQGVTDPFEGIVSDCPAIRGSNVPVGRPLREALGVPVIVENRSRVLAWAECMRQQGVNNLIAFYVSSGVGAGTVLKRQIYRGSIGLAGEVGHTIVQPDGPTCPLGHRGCLESLTSVPAIERDLSAAVGHAVRIHDLDKLYDTHARCREVVDRKADMLAASVSAMLDLLEPEVLVLEGEALAGKRLFGRLERQIRQYSYAARTNPSLEVRRASLEPGEAARSVARLIWHDLEEGSVASSLTSARSKHRRQARSAAPA